MNNNHDTKTNVQSLCDKLAQNVELCCAHSSSCAKLIPTLRKNFFRTNRLFKKALNFEKQTSELSDVLLWLTDNYNFIEEDFCFCIKTLRKEKSKATASGLPFPFVIAKELTDIYDGVLSDHELKAIATSCDKHTEHGLGVSDCSALPVLIKSAVLCQIGELCVKVFDKSGFSESKDESIKLINSIKSLKYLTICDYASVFSVCRLEKILASDPSGAYPTMTTDSKNDLKHSLSIAAKRNGMHDCELAECLLSKASAAVNPNEKYIGHTLCAGSGLSKLYFPLLYGISILFTVISSIVTSFFLFPVLFFPIFESTKLLVDTIFSGICKTSGALPAIDIKEIPDDAKTLCVITALLSGKENDSKLFSRLERIRNANSGKNIRFGLLCDLPDSDSATCSNDAKTISYATGRIESLNTKYGDEFILFIRPRSYSKSEKKFIPYERKRGAVIELTRLIKTGTSALDSSAAGYLQNEDFLSEVRYIITLDADTNLGLNCARRLVGKMLHPANAAIIDKKMHKVVSGYGILQPRMSPDLDSAKATPFSRLLCGSGGTDIYSGAAFDIYQSLFGEGIFCGKGILDVDAFFETVTKPQFFPEDTILSHDILEGERARTALLCDTELTDGFPKNELSYIKRKHRWIRGDIQNLIFLKKRLKIGEKKIKNSLSCLSKYKIYDNARRVFTPLFSFTLLPASLLFDKKLSFFFFFVAFAPCIIPFIIECFNIIKNLSLKSAARKFFSKGITVGIWQSFLRMLFFGCMLAKDAFLSASAALLSAYRMLFSRKKLLEWVTAAQSDSGKPTLLLFISKHLFSSIAGVIIFCIAPGGIIRFSGLAFFVMPIIGYITSKGDTAQKRISDNDKKILRAYAYDIWKFFRDNVNHRERYLPPDNIQLSPYEKTAHRTSPTNIGLYLSCVLAARDFGFIDSKEMASRIGSTLTTIEKLPKWNGNLYNWYDTRSLDILEPKYVSSVDSGNFLACLITVSSGLAEYSDEEAEIVDLIVRINSLIEKTDLRPLYNEKRNLFSVGVTIDGKKATADDGCYDFLMSEARILSYIACATRTVPDEHWKKLARPIISEDGYIGISSWSGTAFEFFMPNLFMPVKKSSLLYESTMFAYRAQRKRNASGIWGISESGFFAFDCDLNYQYKAFGVPSLAKAAGLEHELVISPYSTFLALGVSVPGCLSNLQSMEKLKAYGKYGFYEALDFTQPRVKQGHACVKSYMSHHLGMSLLSISNACFDNKTVSRFMKNVNMQAGIELLEEKIPVNAIIKKLKRSKPPSVGRSYQRPMGSVSKDVCSMQSPVCACISDGKLSCTVSDCGHVEAKKGDCLLFLASDHKHKDSQLDSVFCYLSLDGRIYSLSPLGKGVCPDSSFSFSYTECSAVHHLQCDKGSFSLSYTVSSDHGSVLRMKLSGKPASNNSEFRFVFTPCLSSELSHSAHPAFSELFIESEYDKESKILFYHRRKRSPSDEGVTLAVALSDTSINPVFATRKGFDEEDKYSYFSDTTNNKCGACINPQCIIGGSFGKEISAELLVVLTHDRNSAAEAIVFARKESFDTAEKKLADISSQFTLGAGISSVSGDEIVQTMLSGIQFSTRSHSIKATKYSKPQTIWGNTSNESINSLWKHSVSGDLRIAVIDTEAYFFKTALEKRIRAYKLLAMKNKRFDLVILYTESDRYERRLEKKIKKLITDCGASGFLGRSGGGIHLIEKTQNERDIAVITQVSSFIDDLFAANENTLNAENIHFAEPVVTGKSMESSLPDGYTVKGGLFSENSFIIDKHSKNAPASPFAHILSGENISCVLSQDSLGYTFIKNASECRITPISSGGNRQCDGEKLYLRESGKLFDLIKCASRVIYSCGKAEYYGKVSSCEYKICVFCAHKLPAKAVSVSFRGTLSQSACVYYCAEPCMGNKNVRNVIKAENDSAVFFKNLISKAMSGFTGFLTVLSEQQHFSICDKSAFLSFGKLPAQTQDFACVGTKAVTDDDIVFLLGAAKNKAVFDLVAKSFREDTDRSFAEEKSFSEELIPKISFSHIKSDDKRDSLEKMFNFFLPYDTAFSRFLARAGFYQSGGAYGFRDQLQDCLCILYSDKKRALNHIYRAASHQFPEGDVLHWWHEVTHSGVRTKCSDDYLWLVYACLEYLKTSGDESFLETKLPYISADRLDETAVERYGQYSVSALWESLYHHNIRALDRAVTLVGGHGLCLMGSCDWCDGYSSVGKSMIGESTFTTMFLIMLLERFLPLCQKHDDCDHEEKYRKKIAELKKAVTENCFDAKEGYFIRGYYDDGHKLGASDCDEGKIDLLAQSFSVLSNLDERLCISSLLSAHDKLYDKSIGIMKLLSPPFDKTDREPGYIKGYLSGVRENGGQYTHGALFYALACFELAEKTFEKLPDISRQLTENGEKILLFSNPAFRTSPSSPDVIRNSYMTEPYSVAADIYSNKDHPGRGGWTHYTGACGWMWRLLLRYVFGIEFSNIDTAEPYISINPNRHFPLAQTISGGKLKISEFGFDLTVEYIADGKKSVTADGKQSDGKKIGQNVRSVTVRI